MKKRSFLLGNYTHKVNSTDTLISYRNYCSIDLFACMSIRQVTSKSVLEQHRTSINDSSNPLPFCRFLFPCTLDHRWTGWRWVQNSGTTRGCLYKTQHNDSNYLFLAMAESSRNLGSLFQLFFLSSIWKVLLITHSAKYPTEQDTCCSRYHLWHNKIFDGN